ncbi:MAG: PTS sugar transporter subunit IIA [Simkaniaceae bacterium]
MDLKIKDVAELLSVSETTIRRWLSEGKIPAYRLHHQYRFSRIEIENWMMSFRLKKESSQAETVIYSNKENRIKAPGSQQYSLFRAIHSGILLYEPLGETKEEIMREALKKIAASMSLDHEVICNLFLDRERLMSTALCNGLAVPHTRDFLLEGPHDIVSIAFLDKPISWGALDGRPTEILFFLFAANDKRHLHLLAKIAHLSNDPKALDFLKSRPNKERCLEFIKNWEPK